MNKKREGFRAGEYIIFGAVTLAIMALCVCIGSVNVPLSEFTNSVIIKTVRLPRVLCVALVGASLSVGGAAMQGLLKNPLADGATLGVSGGASLGAVLAMAFGITIPGIPFAGSVVMSMALAFVSLVIVLSLAYKLDYSLSTNTIILLGVIYSMFVTSITSLLVTFAGEKVRDIMFWTLGSLSGSRYSDAIMLAAALLIFGGILMAKSRELNAFAIGEDNARHVGVNVRGVKFTVLICVSALIGVCVSVGGTIGFVGLVTPHMLRMIVGPNHKRLLPASVFGGASFLMLADLIARTLLNPRELSIGVITSFVGALLFVWIFYTSRRSKK